jgi:hypothetical protein
VGLERIRICGHRDAGSHQLLAANLTQQVKLITPPLGLARNQADEERIPRSSAAIGPWRSGSVGCVIV